MTPLDAATSLAVHRSRKLIAEFRLHRPRSATEAVALKAEAGAGAVFMAGDPSYDFALAAMAADARLHFLSLDSSPVVFAAVDGVANQVGLLTAIEFPLGSTLRLLFDRSLRPIVTLALGLNFVDGHITGGRAAIGCAYPVVVAAKLPFDEPLPPVKLACGAAPLAQAVAAELPEPLGDGHGSSGYRQRMIELLLRRNLGAVA